MSAFDGRLWLKGDPGAAVDASIEITGVEVQVKSGGSVIGDWRTDRSPSKRNQTVTTSLPRGRSWCSRLLRLAFSKLLPESRILRLA